MLARLTSRLRFWLEGNLPDEKPHGWRYRAELLMYLLKWWLLAIVLLLMIQLSTPNVFLHWLFRSEPADYVRAHWCRFWMIGKVECGDAFTYDFIPGISFYSGSCGL